MNKTIKIELTETELFALRHLLLNNLDTSTDKVFGEKVLDKLCTKLLKITDGK